MKLKISFEKQDSEQKPEKIKNTNLDILPIRYYDEKVEAFVLEDGSYLDIVEKIGEDFDGMIEDEIQFKMLQFAKFLKMFVDDLKIVQMNFPTNTMQQQNYYRHLLDRTTDPVRRKWILRSLSEFERADKGTRKQEYFFLIHSADLQKRQEHKHILSLLGKGIAEMPPEKKTQIVYKLNNMNSLIIRKEY